MGLRLKSGQHSGHDVQLSIEGDVRIAVEREHAISRIERAVGVGPGCDRFDTQVVEGAVTGAGDTAGDRDLSASRALLRDGELSVDWKRRSGDSRDRCAGIDADGERSTESEVGGVKALACRRRVSAWTNCTERSNRFEWRMRPVEALVSPSRYRPKGLTQM